MVIRAAAVAVLVACSAYAQARFYSYVGALSSESALLAWGTAEGSNTIGRSSPSHGLATVHIAGRTLTSRQNWMVVEALKPDTVYPYRIELEGRQIAESALQTWPAHDNKLVFFVIGDFGTGSKAQTGVAEAMWQEYQRRNAAGNPVRFVLTTGDNVYGDISTFAFGLRHTGAEDRDWGPKFFEPYRRLIEHIPFYPTLGNHDGNETESRQDLGSYLDNFFFPGGKPERYYQFSYAGLADFFGLDTTTITEAGVPSSQYLENGPQFRWMKTAFANSRAPWKIPYFHHPPFNAGPRHPDSLRELQHWVDLFARSGVKVSFQGHEHNFQMSFVNALSRGIRFVVTGAGGQLRTGDITSKLKAANIAAFSAQNHFLVVEIQNRNMKITPLGPEPVRPTDADGQPVPMPIEVNLP